MLTKEMLRFEENRTKKYAEALKIIYDYREKLGFSKETCERAADLLEENFFKEDVTEMKEVPYKNKSATTYAGAAIYKMARDQGYDLTQRKIGEIIGASPNSISANFVEMFDFRAPGGING